MNLLRYKICFISMLGIAMFLVSGVGEASVRDHMLKQTPIGSSFDQVLEYCVSKKLKCYQSTTAGYLNQDTGKTVGVNSIWAVVKERKRTPLTREATSVYWGFGADKRLIDIWVWKTVDAP
jgi:hypothetical protein